MFVNVPGLHWGSMWTRRQSFIAARIPEDVLCVTRAPMHWIEFAHALTEVQVPNPDNELRPGMYMQVKFNMNREIVPVVIPAAALATRSQPQWPSWTINTACSTARSDRTRLRPRDRVLGGLKSGEMVVHPATIARIDNRRPIVTPTASARLQ